MLKTLYTRLALGLFVLLLTVGVVFGLISHYALRHYSATVNQELNRDLAAKLVADRDLIRAGELDMAALKQLFALYMTINPSNEIYLLDAEGTILSYSADPARIKRQRVALQPIRRLLADMDAYPVLGDDPRSHDRQKVFSVTPIPAAAAPEGYLYVVLRGEEYDAAELMARSGHLVEMSAGALLLSLGFGLLAGLAVFRLLTRRLAHLSQWVERFEAEGMQQPPAPLWATPGPGGRDEIDALAHSFEQMAARIASQIEQLQEKDRQRRALVAQVSHDLRTPLASMQGYVESLRLKQASLAPAEQTRFLDIALAEGRRLGRLVDELFELAALEASERQPRPEPFAAAELIHDVAQKHQPAASRRGVSLRVEVDGPLPAAYADLGMTERVLDNLIGNAIGFSATEGGDGVGGGVGEGSVVLHLRADAEALEVQVSDCGPGIPADDLPHIFDPFYRGDYHGEDRAEPRDATAAAGKTAGQAHAGLGLAIAQRIMALQGGSIAAYNNQPPPGASLVIRLPLAGRDVMNL